MKAYTLIGGLAHGRIFALATAHKYLDVPTFNSSRPWRMAPGDGELLTGRLQYVLSEAVSDNGAIEPFYRLHSMDLSQAVDALGILNSRRSK